MRNMGSYLKKDLGFRSMPKSNVGNLVITDIVNLPSLTSARTDIHAGWPQR